MIIERFKLHSSFSPTGDQPNAISLLLHNIKSGIKHQVLLGVTGSGKTFTIANVISKLKTSTIVISHNKVLAYQLYSNFRYFFPNDIVCFYVSHYDYYQPESYSPKTDLYFQKEILINKKLEKYNIYTLNMLLNKCKNIIVVSSVSCIYSNNNPILLYQHILFLKLHQNLDRSVLFKKLIKIFYKRLREGKKLVRSSFICNGNYFMIYPVNEDFIVKIIFISNTIYAIHMLDMNSYSYIKDIKHIKIFPAKNHLILPDNFDNVIHNIKLDLDKQIIFLKDKGKVYEANRLKKRVLLDIDMMENTGYCVGIENYSIYFESRFLNRPFCLLDFFSQDYLMIIDESHMTLPQIRSMLLSDIARKQQLIKHGYRLPSALENRPISFIEFEKLQNLVIYVSATPSKYEISKSNNNIVYQFIRPTGILDPIIDVRVINNEIKDLLLELNYRLNNNEKIIINTLTKNSSEELSKYLLSKGINNSFIHSNVNVLHRISIINNFKKDIFNVLIGVNMLREGLDFPEVSLVIILDADHAGFLRSYTSLTQLIGRASRNTKGKIIMYVKKINKSISSTVKQNIYRRNVQVHYNSLHGLLPNSIISSSFIQTINEHNKPEVTGELKESKYSNKFLLKQKLLLLKKKMINHASKHNFIKASYYRDKYMKLKKEYQKK